MPPDEIILKNEKDRKSNLTIYKYILSIENSKEINKAKILDDDLFVISNVGEDRNCFFRCISYFFTGTEKYHLFFGKLLWYYVISNYNEISAEFPYTYYNGNIIDIDDYIPILAKA